MRLHAARLILQGPLSGGYYTNIYREDKWSHLTESLKTVAKSLRINGFPDWAIIFENIFWALDLVSLASFASRSSPQTTKLS
jgi:hypothetical protein